MKEWREYISEHPAGKWLILADKNTPEDQEDLISKAGGEAVITMKRKPGDYISVSILSASREFDTVTGRLGLENEFYVKLECLKDGWFVLSSKYYKKEEAMKLVALFVGMKKETAMKIWKTKRLGSFESYRIEDE